MTATESRLRDLAEALAAAVERPQPLTIRVWRAAHIKAARALGEAGERATGEKHEAIEEWRP